MMKRGQVMVNFGEKIIYLLSGSALVDSFNKAMKKTCSILSAAMVNMLQNSLPPKQRFLHYFQGLEFDADEVCRYVDFWLYLSCFKIDELKRNPTMAQEMLPDKLIPSSFELQEWIPTLRCFLVCLYSERAILLPYNFSRPQTLWLSKFESEFEVWSENSSVFRKMEAERQKASVDHSPGVRTPEERVLRRLIQCGSKILLTTDMYGPEDLNVKDLKAWRSHQASATDRNQSPVPMRDIANTLIEAFPSRVSADVVAWTGTFNFPSDKRLVDPLVFGDFSHLREGGGTLEERVRDAFFMAKVNLSALSIQGIVECGAIEFSSTICPDKRVQASSEVWLRCEQHFFRARVLEQERPYHTSFGRLNSWLFIYLPLWFSENPDSQYVYPETPSQFTANVHYNCTHEGVIRPLSLVEWMIYMGWTYNATSGSLFRTFFDELIGSEMPGCEQLRQPVITVPPTKKYRTVTKNVLIGPHFLFFVNFLHALEMLSDYFTEHSEAIYRAVLECQKSGREQDMASVGVVTCFFYTRPNLLRKTFIS
jgi:hypothetical protein